MRDRHYGDVAVRHAGRRCVTKQDAIAKLVKRQHWGKSLSASPRNSLARAALLFYDFKGFGGHYTRSFRSPVRIFCLRLQFSHRILAYLDVETKREPPNAHSKERGKPSVVRQRMLSIVRADSKWTCVSPRHSEQAGMNNAPNYNKNN